MRLRIAAIKRLTRGFSVVKDIEVSAEGVLTAPHSLIALGDITLSARSEAIQGQP